MKKLIVVLVVFGFLAGGLVLSCNSPAQQVDASEANVVEAKNDLAQAQREYLDDVENYRLRTAEKIAANDKMIADFKVRIEKEKGETKAEYKAKVAELEEKNRDMKDKMNAYQAESKDQWEDFKAEFNEDMKELGDALEGLVIKNE